VKTSETLIAYFREEAILGKQFRRFRRKHHMPERTIRDQQKKKNTIFHQKKKEKKTDERKWRGWWVPVLVGVVEVLLGVLDLTHFSNTRGFDASQLDLRKLRRFGKREMKWTIELFARQKVPKKHLMKYREKESEK
jgi:hypothetical protein